MAPSPASGPVAPPADAVVLFDGTSLANWRSADSAGGPARWKVADGYMEVVAGTGGIATRREFGDVHLHVEWATPSPPSTGTGQNRGNSGVFLMSTYEVQVLDSYKNPTYADGMAGAIFGQFPPMVNVSRPPGEWQTYDIMFQAPRFDASGAVVRPAVMSVEHNGRLIHLDQALLGPTSHMRRAPYEAHPDRLPIMLQDHGDPVRFRNIWVRELRSNGDSTAARLRELDQSLAALDRMIDSVRPAIAQRAGEPQADSALFRLRAAMGSWLWRAPWARDIDFHALVYPEGAAAQIRIRRQGGSWIRPTPDTRATADSAIAILRRHGVLVHMGEGDPYFEPDDAFLLRTFGPHITEAMQRYLEISVLDYAQPLWGDASLLRSWDEHSARLMMVEQFIARYPTAVDVAGMQRRHTILRRLYFVGADNTEAFNRTTRELSPELRASYERFIASHGDTESGRKVRRYVEALRASGYRRTAAIDSLIAELAPGLQR